MERTLLTTGLVEQSGVWYPLKAEPNCPVSASLASRSVAADAAADGGAPCSNRFCSLCASGLGATRLESSGLKSKMGAGVAIAPCSTSAPRPSGWHAMRAASKLASPTGAGALLAATSSVLPSCIAASSGRGRPKASGTGTAAAVAPLLVAVSSTISGPRVVLLTPGASCASSVAATCCPLLMLPWLLPARWA